MPCHLVSDVSDWHEGFPTVPIYYPAKPQPRERASDNQRRKEDSVEPDSSRTL